MYAGVDGNDDTFTLWRDPLGSHKLFFGKSSGGDWVVANRIHRLLLNDVRAQNIHSCPPGHILRVDSAGIHRVYDGSLATLEESDAITPKNLHLSVAPALDEAFEAIANQFCGARFVVALSGGLDSTVIAHLASRHLPGITACSFSFCEDPARARSSVVTADVSEDFVAAQRVAQVLNIPLLPALRSRADVGPALLKAVTLGQDWRDFNVHCAVVNLFLAEHLRAEFPGERVVVLTGDLMNEYVCDYHEELVDGAVYYQQPKISIGRRRRFFVRGLDAGDREVGVFNSFGLTLVQPYAAVADLYMQLPARHLSIAGIKIQLNGPLLPREIRDCVTAAKTRAQVGGADGGVLGVCHRIGFDQERLKATWIDSFPANDAGDAIDLIQYGGYRP